MGFFDKAKQMLNIGGVKVVLKVGPDIARTSGKASGTLTLSTKSPQHVKSIKVVLERKIITLKQGLPMNSPMTMQNTDTRWDNLGDFVSKEEFDMVPGQDKVVEFAVQFNLPQSSNDAIAAQIGGVMVAVGGMGASMNNRNAEYQVRANVDVDKAALDATDLVQVRIV